MVGCSSLAQVIPAAVVEPSLFPLLIDSVTRFGPDAAGRVVIGGSHAGLFAAYLVACARVRAVILNDAGVGRDRAGIAGLDYLDRFGIAAAAVGHDSARIGDAADIAVRGMLRHVNRAAAALGCEVGQVCRTATAILIDRAPPARMEPPPERESRQPLAGPWGSSVSVAALDSVSLVTAADAGAIVVSGSHGGLLGARPETAIKVDAFAALYNDACGGIDDAGFSRLPALDRRHIAAATVDGRLARIGDGHSTYDDGVLSRVNQTSAGLGAAPGMSAKAFVALMAERRQRSAA